VDKTPPTADIQHKALAAIKMAHLLLLDRVLHPEKPIYIKGGEAYLQQAQMIVAALQVHARQAGIVLESADLIITVPGWKNWRGSTSQNMAAAAQMTGHIEGVITRHLAQDELKDKMRLVRGKTIIVDEQTHPPRKH
jgi:hypothetical protein